MWRNKLYSIIGDTIPPTLSQILIKRESPQALQKVNNKKAMRRVSRRLFDYTPRVPSYSTSDSKLKMRRHLIIVTKRGQPFACKQGNQCLVYSQLCGQGSQPVASYTGVKGSTKLHISALKVYRSIVAKTTWTLVESRQLRAAECLRKESRFSGHVKWNSLKSIEEDRF